MDIKARSLGVPLGAASAYRIRRLERIDFGDVGSRREPSGTSIVIRPISARPTNHVHGHIIPEMGVSTHTYIDILYR